MHAKMESICIQTRMKGEGSLELALETTSSKSRPGLLQLLFCRSKSESVNVWMVVEDLSER